MATYTYPGTIAPLGGLPIGVGNAPPPSPAGNFIQYVRLHWLARHPVTNAIILDPIPHIHQSRFKVVFAQPGMPFDTAIGDFEIPLIPPSDESRFAWAKPYYDQLAEYQRVEAYLIEHDGQGPAGDPVFTGVITKLPRDMKTYSIAGKDSLHWLTLKHTHRADTFTGSTDQLFTYALKGYAKVFGDDFTGNLSAYTNNGNWTQVTDDGLSSIKGGQAGYGVLFTSTYANANYADCEISAPMHLIARSGAAGTAVCDGGIVAAVADANNLVLGQVVMAYQNPSRWDIQAQILTRSAGVDTLRAVNYLAAVSSTADFRPFLQLFGKQSGNSYTWQLLIDGEDVNCTWTTTSTPSGGVGVRNTTGTCYVKGGLSGLAFLNKAALFQAGNVGVGAQRISQAVPITKNSDLMNLAISTEGWSILKRPKAGVGNDVLDFNANPAGDLSALVRFEEGENLVEGAQEPNAEPPGTSIVVSGSPSSSGQSLVKWYALAAMDQYGLVEDVVNLPHAIDQVTIHKQAHQVLSNRAKPHKAKRLVVHRAPRHNHHNAEASPTGLRWREGHFVTLHIPRNGFYNQKMQVIGFEMREGQASMDVLGDQYPQHLDIIPDIRRLRQAASQLGLRTDQISPKTVDGTGLIRDTRLVLPSNPWKMRVYRAAGQTIGAGVVLINFDTVSFDSSNGWDATNFQWVVPVTGVYEYTINVYASFPTMPGGGGFFVGGCYLYVNGGSYDYSPPVWVYLPADQGGNDVTGCNLSGTRFLNKGDTVQAKVQFAANYAGSFVVLGNGSTGATHMDFHLISG